MVCGARTWLNAFWFECRHLAASEGSYKVTEWLLSEQADINSLDRFKRTPLEVFLLLPCFKATLLSVLDHSSAHFCFFAGCCSWGFQ